MEKKLEMFKGFPCVVALPNICLAYAQVFTPLLSIL